MTLILEENYDHIRLMTIETQSIYNPFSSELNISIRDAFKKANSDDKVKSIILTSGRDKSLSVGADFAEIKNYSTKSEVFNWVNEVFELYKSVLLVNKPTIISFDNYAIGMAFQLSMMFDYKIMTYSAEFRMPEVPNGIACTLGSVILEHCLGYNIMKEIVFVDEPIKSDYAIKNKLVNQVVSKENLLKSSLDIANKFSKYPNIAFSNTKKVTNARFLKKLSQVIEETQESHSECFMLKSADKHFKNILKSKY